MPQHGAGQPRASYPRHLSQRPRDGGLRAALEDLVGTSEVPARLALHDLDGGIAAETAMAAYATVAAALARRGDHASSEAQISVGLRDGR